VKQTRSTTRKISIIDVSSFEFPAEKISIIDVSSFEFPADFSTKEPYEKRRTGKLSPSAPMNHLKLFKGGPPRDAHSKLVQL